MFLNISLFIAHWPYVFSMLSISLVNDSELHYQSHFESVVWGLGFHGGQRTLMLLARFPILTIYMHPGSRNLICGLTSDLHLGMWHLLGECVSDTGSHLKKSLTIKSRSEGWLKMVAEQHGSSNASWNNNVFCCVAVSSLISYPLIGKDLTWDSNNVDNVLLLLSEIVNGKIHSNTDFTYYCYFTFALLLPYLLDKISHCIHRASTLPLSVMTRFTFCPLSGSVWMDAALFCMS